MIFFFSLLILCTSQFTLSMEPWQRALRSNAYLAQESKAYIEHCRRQDTIRKLLLEKVRNTYPDFNESLKIHISEDDDTIVASISLDFSNILFFTPAHARMRATIDINNPGEIHSVEDLEITHYKEFQPWVRNFAMPAAAIIVAGTILKYGLNN